MITAGAETPFHVQRGLGGFRSALYSGVCRYSHAASGSTVGSQRRGPRSCRRQMNSSPRSIRSILSARAARYAVRSAAVRSIRLRSLISLTGSVITLRAGPFDPKSGLCFSFCVAYQTDQGEFVAAAIVESFDIG